MTISTIIDDIQTESLSRNATARAIRRLRASDHNKPMIVPARGDEGTNTWGMYCEIVHVSSYNDAPVRHTRYFIYGNHMFAASRLADATKATWKSRDVESLQHALDAVQDTLAKPNAKLHGRILLVEMKADDISTLEAGEVPGARFRGQYRNDKLVGKYNWETDIQGEGMSAQARRYLNPNAA
jgi:hypothetical protein